MIEFKSDNLKFPGNYRGKVLDNVDSSQFGRIKVEIFGIFDGIAAADIPWAVPAFPISSGAGSGYGSFSVPEIGTYVWCFFEYGDMYQPVYFAEASDGVHGLPTERTTNYPSRKVLKTKNDIVVYIDDSAKEIKIVHPEGSYIEITSDGKINVSGGDISVTGEAIVISGTTVHINP